MVGGVISYTNTQNEFYSPENLYTFAYQSDNCNKLGFSGSWNSIEAGFIAIPENKEYKLYNSFYNIGAGYCFYSNKIIDNAIGITANYSRLIQDSGLGFNGYRVLGNIGYILQIQKKFKIGLSLKDFNITNDNYSSILVSFCIGLGYKESFTNKVLKLLDLSTEISYVDWLSSTIGMNSIQTGFEASFLQTLSARLGFLFYFGNSLYDFPLGGGLSLFNHFDIDWYCVYGTIRISYCFGPYGRVLGV